MSPLFAGRSFLRRRLFSGLIWPGLAIFFFAACGGTDDVEYPALAVSLTNPDGNTAGTVRVYARFQNPVFDTEAILEQSTPSAQNTVQITPAALVSAMTQAQARGIPWPNSDTIAFNLIGLNPGGQAFASDFLLTRSGSDYRFQKTQGHPWVLNNGVLSGSLALSPPATNLRGQVGLVGETLGLDSIFISGSPFAAAVQADGSFLLPSLPPGIYALNALSRDSLVYTSQDSLNTDSSFTATGWNPAAIIWLSP